MSFLLKSVYLNIFGIFTKKSHLCQVQMDNVKDQGDEDLYAKLDSAYSTEDEDKEVDILASALSCLFGERDADCMKMTLSMGQIFCNSSYLMSISHISEWTNLSYI